MVDQNVLEVSGGVREISTDETRIFSVDLTSAGVTSPTSPTIVGIFDEDDLSTDIQATAFPSGSNSLSSLVFTLKPLVGSALTVFKMYKVFLSVTDSGNTVTVFFRLWVPERSTSATPPLVTVPMCLEYMESDVSGAQIQRLIDDADNEVVRVAGSHPTATRSEQLVGGEVLLFLPAPAASITSVTEHLENYLGGTTTVLASDDYRLWFDGRALQRLSDGTNSATRWGSRIDVVYTPVDDIAQRRKVILDLVQLGLQYQPGVQSERIGDYSHSNNDYLVERNNILKRVVPMSRGVL